MARVSRRRENKRGHIGAYHVYGLRLDSEWPLPYPRRQAPSLADVSLRKGSAKQFQQALAGVDLPESGAPWATAILPDGSRYLRWSGTLEFLIPKTGRSVTCRPLTSLGRDAFHTHLGPSLSFALINLGIEPLHSTTLTIDGEAVALMGDCGYGKSSLGAAFVRAGHPLLTDDLLVVAEEKGRYMAYPGAPRVKLFPKIAKVVFGRRVQGLHLKTLSPKLIIPLDERRSQQTPVPLNAIYMLTPPGARVAPHVTIKRLSPRRSFLELVRNTFNMSVSEPERLERQFALATRLAMSVPVKSLSYPRELRMLSEARKAILDDLKSSSRSGD